LSNLNLKKGTIIVVSAPSGSGKTTIVKQLLAEFPELKFSISATTRAKRENETNGVEYFFISEEEFLEKIKRNEFVEWEKFYDYYYDTFKSVIEDTINSGQSVILEVYVKGALAIKNIYPDAVLIYIVPPSFDELVKRLKNRKTETPEDFRKRILRMEMELNERKKFDYFIENSVLEKAVEDAKSLIKKIIKGEDDGNSTHRSEERRVGKECRSRWTRNE